MLISVRIIHRFVITFLFLFFVNTTLFADVIINVLAVNGADSAQEKEVNFSLPGELEKEDILDTNGLSLDYDLDNAGFYVHGKVQLGPKESKTYKVRIRDVWKMSDERVNEILDKIEQGLATLPAEDQSEDSVNALRYQLEEDLNQIIELHQNASSVEQRIDAHRTYQTQLERIEKEALSVDYWRSNPREEVEERIITFNIEVENPTEKIQKSKAKSYLPQEIKPEHVVNREGFEFRYDERKKQPFLFKEEDLDPGQKKKYTIGVKDVWYIPDEDLSYARFRADDAIRQLSNSRFIDSAQILYNQIVKGLDEIIELQAQKVGFRQHVSNYRFNKAKFEDILDMIDDLEKLLAKYRENLEVSKIKNVLQKIRSLKSLAKVSRAIFDKKPKVNAAWKIIGAVMVFLGVVTLIYFAVWMMRSGKEKDLEDVESSADSTSKEEEE